MNTQRIYPVNWVPSKQICTRHNFQRNFTVVLLLCCHSLTWFLKEASVTLLSTCVCLHLSFSLIHFLLYFLVSSKINNNIEISKIDQCLQITWAQGGWGQKPSEIHILEDLKKANMRDLTNSFRYRKPFSWAHSLLDTRDSQSQDTNSQTTTFLLPVR